MVVSLNGLPVENISQSHVFYVSDSHDGEEPVGDAHLVSISVSSEERDSSPKNISAATGIFRLVS